MSGPISYRESWWRRVLERVFGWLGAVSVRVQIWLARRRDHL